MMTAIPLSIFNIDLASGNLILLVSILMFIAIIIPPAKKSRPILGAIAISIVITCALRYIPIFGFITEGFAMIIATVLAAAIMAKIAPIKDDNKIDEDADINTKEVCHE